MTVVYFVNVLFAKFGSSVSIGFTSAIALLVVAPVNCGFTVTRVYFAED